MIGAARRHPRRLLLGGLGAVVLVVALVLLAAGGGSNGLASSYSCSGALGYDLNFSNTGNGQGQGLSGTVTNSPSGEGESFDQGDIKGDSVYFGYIDDPSGDDPGDLQDGAILQSDGDLSFDGGQIVCSP